MESRGPGIYNPLLERCPASPSPSPGLGGPRMCRKDVTRGGGAEEGSRAWPGLGVVHSQGQGPSRTCPSGWAWVRASLAEPQRPRVAGHTGLGVGSVCWIVHPRSPVTPAVRQVTA